MPSKLSLLLAAICVALPVAASAQVNKCVIGGATVYQQAECPTGAKGVSLMAAPPRAVGSADYLADLMKRRDAAIKRRDEDEARRNPLCRDYAIKAIYIGMNEAEFRCFDRYRDPTQVNVTTTAHGSRKQYVFRDIQEYLYVENGVLTSMQGQQ